MVSKTKSKYKYDIPDCGLLFIFKRSRWLKSASVSPLNFCSVIVTGDPFAGVIRELWNDVSGYKISDLTSNPDFPNNPSSIEVLDKFDAPFNVGDNYGSRVRGFFKAPETGYYRYSPNIWSLEM